MKGQIEIDILEKSHFIKCFNELEDKRNQVRVRYPMQEVLFLVICSVVSGYESNRGIEEFGKLKQTWLRKYFPFTHGIPYHETIGNIIGLIDKQLFESAFIDWVNLQFGKNADALIHIDGKRISGSVDKRLQAKKAIEGGKNAELILNAYASNNNTVVAQINVSESGDEQEGAKRLIDQIDLKDKTITGDSNFCIREILSRIVNKQGNYVMTLKKNNRTLYGLAERAFEEYSSKATLFQTKDKGHGRKEIRTYQSLKIDDIFYDKKFDEYSDLFQLIKVERNRVELRSEKTSEETHYYISNLDKGIITLAHSIRSHWSVENNLHWILDVEFNEDGDRKRTGNQASNFSLIRKIVLNLINKSKGNKSIKAMRMSCALSDQVRQNVLGIP